MDVIDNINALLKEKGINGAELSRMIGVSSAVYSQWNRKVTKPSNKNIAKVANALGVPVSYLTGEGQKESPPHGGEPPAITDWEKALDGKSKEELKEIMDIVMKKFMEAN